MRLSSRSGVYQGVALLGLLGALAGVPGLGTPASGTSGSPTSSTDWAAMGHLASASGKLRAGCHRHYYSYRVSPPSPQWSLETFLVGPRGKRLASDVIISGADKKAGSKFFTICKANTRTGRFTIKGKLTYNDYPASPSGWIRPAYFRLTRP